MRSILKYIPFALIAVLLTACDAQWDSHIKPGEMKGKTIMEMLKEHPKTTLFAAAVEKAGYADLLSGDKVITVFAPANEALSGVDMNDVEGLKHILRNHIAFAAYSMTDGSFSTSFVEMLNAKNASTKPWSIGGVAVSAQTGNHNLSLRNGVLHIVEGVIPFQKNIWEYLRQFDTNKQIQFIKKQDSRIMDMERSIQIGVDPRSGRPLYDTIWIDINPFLLAYPLNDESKRFSFVLMPEASTDRIEAKYAKYFRKDNAVIQDSIVRSELLKDCILLPVEITADGRFSSVDGVLMDVKLADIQQVYEASNGTVYVVSDADVKVFENKVKTIMIEGEDFFSHFSNNANSWLLRERPTLSGGRDMVSNSPTTFITQYVYSDADTTITVSINRTFVPNSTSNVGNVNNVYIEYRPVINSVPYKMYWSAYNDYPSNINLPVSLSINTGKQTVSVTTHVTAKFSQKLMMSFPDRPRVHRNASTTHIVNNFSANTTFASSRFVAGVQEEKQLKRFRLNDDPTLLGFALLSRNLENTGEDDFFNVFTGEDAFGNKDQVISPTYGTATILVANTTENRASNSGMIFVDYIKLVPVVDPNE